MRNDVGNVVFDLDFTVFVIQVPLVFQVYIIIATKTIYLIINRNI